MGDPDKEKLAAIAAAQPQCTLITLGPEGHPRARTITRLNDPRAGFLDFATDRRERKVREIGADPRATVFFVDPKTRDHASVYGTAEILEDAGLKRGYWREEFRRYWPAGPDDPSFIILRVRAETGEFLLAEPEKTFFVRFD